MNPTCRTRARTGFTLVELVTVMGILAILVTLVVGAAKGLQTYAARTATDQIIIAIDVGLQAYYDDWGKYPWYDDSQQHPMGGAAGYKGDMPYPNYCMVPGGGQNRPEATLYAALNMRQRHGPYMSSLEGMTATLDFRSRGTYSVFADGWGRPILYGPPVPGEDVQTPRLESQGPDVFSVEDNIKNYDWDDTLEGKYK